MAGRAAQLGLAGPEAAAALPSEQRPPSRPRPHRFGTRMQAGADECIDMAHHKPDQLKGLLRHAASQGKAGRPPRCLGVGTRRAMPHCLARSGRAPRSALPLACPRACKRLLPAPAGVDCIFDPVGGAQLMESLKAARWGAHILIIGFASGAALCAAAPRLGCARLRAHAPRCHVAMRQPPGGLPCCPPPSAASPHRTRRRARHSSDLCILKSIFPTKITRRHHPQAAGQPAAREEPDGPRHLLVRLLLPGCL